MRSWKMCDVKRKSVEPNSNLKKKKRTTNMDIILACFETVIVRIYRFNFLISEWKKLKRIDIFFVLCGFSLSIYGRKCTLSHIKTLGAYVEFKQQKQISFAWFLHSWAVRLHSFILVIFSTNYVELHMFIVMRYIICCCDVFPCSVRLLFQKVQIVLISIQPNSLLALDIWKTTLEIIKLWSGCWCP